MHTKTHAAQTAQAIRQQKPQQSLPTPSKHTKTAIRLIVVGAVILVVAITGWNKLRAEFDESFNRFSACHTVALERSA